MIDSEPVIVTTSAGTLQLGKRAMFVMCKSALTMATQGEAVKGSLDFIPCPPFKMVFPACSGRERSFYSFYWNHYHPYQRLGPVSNYSVLLNESFFDLSD